LEQRVEMVADHVLVQLREDVDPGSLLAALPAEDQFTLQPVNRNGLYRLSVDAEDPDAIPAALSMLQNLDGMIRFAEPDYIVHTLAEPDDPSFLNGSLWGMNNTGQNSGLAGADISALDGWAIRTDASSIVVGIVDTGILSSHEDLRDNLWFNPAEVPDGVDNDGNGFVDDIHGINAITLNGDPTDDAGHGSHVAGTIGASGNNTKGVVGVAWNVQLMALKFLSSGGGGAISDAVTCIDYGVDNGANILNNSWGGGFYSQALYDAVERARDAGVIFVVAAGNATTSLDSGIVYPASLPFENVVAVASTTRNDELSDFSNFGQGMVDIAAPGSEIYSVGIDNDSHYRYMSGTSMATPHVVGALALMASEFPDEPWYALINRLYRGMDTLPSLGEGRVGTGGRLNLFKALSGTDNRPPNDDFQDARLLHGDAMVLRLSNRGATSEAGEPALGSEAAPNSLWFRFIPQSNGQSSVTVVPVSPLSDQLQYANINAVVGVYIGDDLANLTPVTVGEDKAAFVAQKDEVYHIAVAGVDNAEGLIMLEVAGPPRNSDLTNAIAINIGRGYTATNRNALPEDGEAAHAGQDPQASVWFKWTAGVSGTVAFHTRGSQIKTVAAVYRGPAEAPTHADLLPVASNIYATGVTNFSRVQFFAEAGTTYYMVVDGLDGAEGFLSIALGIPVHNDNFANSFVISGQNVQRTVSTQFASRQVGEPNHMPGLGNGETVWYSWTAQENSRITITNSGAFPITASIAAYTGSSVDALTLVARDGADNRTTKINFDALQGTTYHIAVEPTDWTLGNMPLTLESNPVPPNEIFTNAALLSGIRTSTTGSNAGATREPGEPSSNFNGSGSVWYKWTAPISGEFGIYGERMDKPRRWNIVLNVFTGNAVNQLTHVKEDYGNGIGRDAFVHWQATAGRTYYLQVTSINSDNLFGGEGPFRLDLRPVSEHAAPNDDMADAITLDGSTVYNFRTHTYGLTAEPGEPAHSGITATETLWWKFTPRSGMGGRYTVSTAQAEGGWLTTIYRTTNAAAPDFNNLVPVANNYDWADMAFPDVSWNAEPDVTYYIVHDRVTGVRGRFIFHFQKVPDNFRFSGAEVIQGTQARIVTYNWGSIREPNEPRIGASATQLGSRSLWWKWTAPESGRYQLDTIGSETPVPEDNFANPEKTVLGFDTRLGVYTGTSLLALNEVVRNDSRSSESFGNSWMSFARNSLLQFNAVAGQTYYFLVNGENIAYNGTDFPAQTNTGKIHLNLTLQIPPANDAFSGATRITTDDFHVVMENHAATKEPGEPNHGGISGGRSLWWKWTASESGPFIISTSGTLYSDFHARKTGIGVYTGSSVSSLSLIASDQNSAGINTGDNTWSSLTFNAVAGTTYYFAADSAFAGELAFIFTRPAPNDNFADATEMRGSRWQVVSHNLETSVEPGEPRIDGGYSSVPDNNFRSVWWKWTAPASGEITLDSLGSQSMNLLGVFTGNAVDNLTPISEVPLSSGNPFNGDSDSRSRSGNNRRPLIFNAEAGTTYYISFQGAGFVTTSSGPLLLTLFGPPAQPFAPESFTAARIGTSQVQLNWQDVAVDEEAYEIERSVNGIDWQTTLETQPNTTSAIDVVDIADGFSHYRIRAVNSVGESAWMVADVLELSPLEAWRWIHFLSTDVGSDALDTDNDGVPNLLEYLFGTDPNNPDSVTLPEHLLVEANDNIYHGYAVQLDPNATGVDVRLETSADLENWTSDPLQLIPVIWTNRERSVRSAIPIEEDPQRFFRVIAEETGSAIP
jgi:hypothetical protein